MTLNTCKKFFCIKTQIKEVLSTQGLQGKNLRRPPTQTPKNTNVKPLHLVC